VQQVVTEEVSDRNEAIERLKKCALQIAARGATALYLYGSTARDEGTPDSDVDLLIDYDPNGAFNTLDLVGLKSFIEEQLDRPVDLTSRDGLHPALQSRIEASAVRIF
jgi:uncharacterized protein